MGRPTDYNQDIATRICELLVEGHSLRAICRRKEMPGLSTVFQWFPKHPDFAEQYARAKEEQADTFADEMLDIADTEEDVQRAKLKVDVRKWIASKMKPKRYGDRTTLVGDEDQPITTVTRVELVPVYDNSED